jgi:hypothetical protein
LPDEDGVFELVAELQPKRFAAPLVRGKPLAERQVQLVVLKRQRPEPASRDWAMVGEFDPAQPKLWDRLMRLPTMKIVPGLSKGPLGNEPTGTREHVNITWSTLKAGAWQAYPLPVSEPNWPHILEVEFPSDLEQSLAISIIEPNAAGLVAPLGVDSGIDVTVTPGRTPQTLSHRLVFWPRTKSPLVLLANRHDDAQAVFGKIKVLSGPAQLMAASRSGDAQRSRLAAAYFEKPLFPENFSVADSSIAPAGQSTTGRRFCKAERGWPTTCASPDITPRWSACSAREAVCIRRPQCSVRPSTTWGCFPASATIRSAKTFWS